MKWCNTYSKEKLHAVYVFLYSDRDEIVLNLPGFTIATIATDIFTLIQ